MNQAVGKTYNSDLNYEYSYYAYRDDENIYGDLNHTLRMYGMFEEDNNWAYINEYKDIVVPSTKLSLPNRQWKKYVGTSTRAWRNDRLHSVIKSIHIDFDKSNSDSDNI